MLGVMSRKAFCVGRIIPIFLSNLFFFSILFICFCCSNLGRQSFDRLVHYGWTWSKTAWGNSSNLRDKLYSVEKPRTYV